MYLSCTNQTEYYLIRSKIILPSIIAIAGPQRRASESYRCYLDFTHLMRLLQFVLQVRSAVANRGAHFPRQSVEEIKEYEKNMKTPSFRNLFFDLLLFELVSVAIELCINKEFKAKG